MADNNGIFSLNPGALDSIMTAGTNQARSNALDAGLINLGAGLIGGPTLKEGLSRGLSGFNQGYNDYLNTNKPKVTPLADGAFTQITLPDGTSKIIRHPEVADLMREKWQYQALSKEQLAKLQAGLKLDNDVTKDAATNAGGLTSTTGLDPKFVSTVGKIDDFMKTWNDTDAQGKPTADPSASNPNKVNIPLFGSVESPKLAGAIDTIKGTVGTSEDYNKRKELDMFFKNEVSKTLKEMGSNPSTADLMFKVKQIPDAFNTPSAVLSKWLADYKEAITTAESRRQEAAKIRDQRLGKSAAPMPGAAPPKPNVPTFASPDEVRAAVASGKLKSGSTFLDPNGVERTVP